MRKNKLRGKAKIVFFFLLFLARDRTLAKKVGVSLQDIGRVDGREQERLVAKAQVKDSWSYSTLNSVQKIEKNAFLTYFKARDRNQEKEAALKLRDIGRASVMEQETLL